MTERQGPPTGIVLTLALLCGLAPAVQGQQGHVVRADQVRVDRASHWRAWQGASSLVEISEQGIKAVLVRKEINAALDAGEFFITTADESTPGGVSVGSNSGESANVIDGDLTTSWGPDPDSPLKDWWLEVNLGRLVVVEKIVIHFAEQGEGDPFLQFKVMGWRLPSQGRSSAQYMLAGTDIPVFWQIGRTDRPNKTRRVFEFVPHSTAAASDQFVGDPLDRILVIPTHSDFLRAREISRDEYEALPAEQRGAVEYYRRELSGREQLVPLEQYEVVDEERKGAIRYYRRELPRIAEIEVITEGDNVNLGVVERGGSVIVETCGETTRSTPTAADGNYATGHNKTLCPGHAFNYLQDLGGLFWVDTMHFLLDGSRNEWAVDVSDGTRAPDGSISYTPFGYRQSGGFPPANLRYRAVMFEPTKVRFLRATFRNNQRSSVGIDEILLYGAGYVPEVRLTSDLIRFDRSKNLVSIEWDSDVPEGTYVQIQTRTGNELEEERIYYDSRGNEVTESRYNKLPGSKKGDIESRFLPGGDWSAWSVPYKASGAEITSPSPRQFMQLRTTLITDRGEAAAFLRSITVEMSDPVAERVVGEVWPLRAERVGEEEEFSLYIRPDFADGRQGFDEIRIEASTGTRMELLAARFGTDSDFESGTATRLTPAEVELLNAAVDTLHFRLPSPIRRGADVVAVRFRAAVFGNSASFRAFVRDGADGSWQRVDGGDATDLVNSQRLTVLALEGSEVIRDLTLDSPVLTPNADGVNDELVLRFSVARVSGEQPVALTLYDLGGRIVRSLEERRLDARGRYAMHWDGTDAGGNRVPPGIYLARLVVDVDAGSAEDTAELHTVFVAY